MWYSSVQENLYAVWYVNSFKPSEYIHICVSNLTIIGSNNGLSPGRCQVIIWTNDRMLLTEPLGTNFSEILIEILKVLFKKMRLKGSSAKWQPFCLGLNVLIGKCVCWNSARIVSVVLIPVLKIRTIRHAQDLWTLVWSYKQLRLL